ncbi:hypothetical protein [Pseudalkalibacillus berkeleyi]|uniref:Uncharacterized protein n=1 Tax=Pseudalkalibacillus berkeleyi TaxID=1069813 RepID=A0ABS9GZ27_9BACL|nr:hypothetical protein [Pseudalkalibacillus berkeleyi]MCF6136904.1 hypothetical protein [Pseudalkalibacillus berkeleyi]
MNPQKELSYDRLASRTKYYQEKSLQLEKKLLFAEEKMEQLEIELKDARENDELNEKIQQQEEELEAYHQEVHRLKEQLSQSNLTAMTKKILSFEELLETVEKEINEKETLIESYKSKIKSLEKRIKVKNNSPEELGSKLVDKENLQLTAYFNHSLICKSESSYVIHGSFHMTNNGTEELDQPLVCFRFQPIDYTNLKGKISSLEQSTISEEKQEADQWVYIENEWAKEARERGEIWVAPMHDLTIQPNQTISISDFQIPIKKQFEDSIIIEAFVYFQNKEYRARAMNQIALNF